MDDLIIRRLRGEAGDVEMRRLERWRQASPDNERSYREVEALWRLAEAGREAPGTPPDPPAASDLIGRAEARRTRRARAERRRSLLRSPWPAWGLLAAAGMAALLFTVRPARDAGPEAPALSAVESVTGTGEVSTLALSDGSVVRLGPGASVGFPRDADARAVHLRGRAFFAVRPSARPFVVRTDQGEIRVRGTRFEVASGEGGETRVVVVEGRVSVEGGTEGSAEVSAGQVAYLDGASPPRVLGRADVWSLLSWPGGLLIFQATPLSEVAAEVARHFDTPVEVDPAVAEIRVTAWFGDEPLEDVVSAVCTVTGTACAVGPAGVRIEP